MPRMIDLVRSSRLPSNLMQFAACGALSAPPGETIETLVHLALHNHLFGAQAGLTLAGWDKGPPGPRLPIPDQPRCSVLR